MTKFLLRTVCGLYAVGFLSIAPSVYAQADKCLPALIQDSYSVKEDTSVAFALSQLLTSSASSDDTRNISIGLPIDGVPVNLAGKQATRLAQSISRATGISWDRQTSIRALISTLPENSVKAYRTCVEGTHTSGPRIYIYDTTPTHAVVKVAWHSAAGAPTSAAGDIAISGGKAQSAFPTKWTTGEDAFRIVERIPHQDLLVTANIGHQGATEMAPYIPQVVVKRKSEEIVTPTAPAVLRLSNNDGRDHHQGPISDCYFAPDDAELRGDSASVAWVARAGHLDNTSYAKVLAQDNARVCWEAHLRPLSREGGAICSSE